MTVLLEPVSQAGARPPSMVERMTLIMDAFEGSNTRLLLEEIASRTGLPRSTAHRILDQLMRLQWVEHGRAGYRLGRRIHEWGARENAHSDLRAAASTWLHELAIKTELVVHLGVACGSEIEYLDKVGGRRVRTIASRVGGRAPSHHTALGKAMLAWMSPEEIEALYPHGLLGSREGRAGLLELHQELGRIRHFGGVAQHKGDRVSGVSCVGVAIRGSEGPVGAVSLAGPVGMPMDKLAPLVRDTAQRISLDLFGTSR